MTSSTLLEILLSFMSGVIVGSIYFLLLFQTVRLHRGLAGFRVLGLLYLLRLAGAGAVFWALAQLGALPVLAALAGFLVARSVFQWRVTAQRSWK